MIHSHGRYPAASVPTDPVGRKRMRLSTDLVQGAAGDRVELGANLSRMETGALAFARAQGLKFVVVRAGDRLEQTGALRQQDPEQWNQHLPELKELGEAVYAHQAEVRAAFAGMSAEEKQNARTALNSLLSSTGKPLTTCASEKITVEEWAARHGASNAQEVATFEKLLRGINGSRMGDEKVLTPAQQGLLAPELYFYGPQEGRMLLNRYDHDATLLWQGSQDTVVEDPSQAADGGARGQLFPDANLILIRERALNGDRTAIHELAHGIDFLLEKQAPEWYSSWKAQMEQAFSQARQRGTITDYAKANVREYLAEGIAHFIFEKEKLQQSDPALHRLSEAMLSKAAQMAGVDPELERSHLSLLVATQEQVSRALQAAQANPSESRQDLAGASVQLKKTIAAMKTAGLQTATQMLQFGMLSGAVDAVLQHVLESTPPEVTPDQTRALAQAGQADPIETAFRASESGQLLAQGQMGALEDEYQLAYLAGASLAYRMRP